MACSTLEHDYITAADVLGGIAALKRGKATGSTWVTAELLKFMRASSAFVVCVASLLSCALHIRLPYAWR